jgi:hypothetical protein
MRRPAPLLIAGSSAGRREMRAAERSKAFRAKEMALEIPQGRAAQAFSCLRSENL